MRILKSVFPKWNRNKRTAITARLINTAERLRRLEKDEEFEEIKDYAEMIKELMVINQMLRIFMNLKKSKK